MNSSGIAAAGGVGRYMAEWIIDGQPSIDLWSVDIRRFIDMHNNKKFLKDRVTEVLGNCLKMHLCKPRREPLKLIITPTATKI